MSRFFPHVSSCPRAFAALAAVTVVGAAALLGAPAVAAAAQPAAEAPRTSVYYNPRELSTDEGTRALYHRIVIAARSVCPGYDSRDLSAFAHSRQCQRQAVAGAIRQIGNRRLAAVSAVALGRQG